MYVVCKERIRQKVCHVYANDFVAIWVHSLEAWREAVMKSWLVTYCFLDTEAWKPTGRCQSQAVFVTGSGYQDCHGNVHVLKKVSLVESESFVVKSSNLELLLQIDPVCLLEAHKANLRESYEDWLDKEPPDVESEHPTDEKMEAFAEAELRLEKNRCVRLCPLFCT